MASYGLFVRSFHKNLQRLSSLTICCSAAHAVPAGSLAQTVDRYRELLVRRVSVPEAKVDDIVNYISDRALVLKYASGKDATANKVRTLLLSGGTIEVQDSWLSDPSLPASTGGERDQSFARTVAVCQELQLLKSGGAVTLQPPGQLIVSVAADSRLLPLSDSPTVNPFRPNLATASVTFYAVLRADFQFLSHLLRHIPVTEFSFQDVARSAERILKELMADIPNTVNTKDDRDWVKKQLASAERLTARLGASERQARSAATIQTLYRPLEDLLLTRLEFLCDIGALAKLGPTRYQYRRTVAFERLREIVDGNPKAVDDSYFDVFGSLFNVTAVPIRDHAAILEHLRAAFLKSRAASGYAPIAETLLRANALSQVDADGLWRIAELSSTREALEAGARSSPPSVRITADRLRRPHSFRLVE